MRCKLLKPLRTNMPESISEPPQRRTHLLAAEGAKGAGEQVREGNDACPAQAAEALALHARVAFQAGALYL